MAYAAWVCVAILSHALSSLFPFLAARVLKTQGAYGGSFLLYLVAACVLTVGYMATSAGRSALAEGVFLARKSNHRRLVWGLLIGYTLVVFLFYSGLKASELQPEQYGFVARLESVCPYLLGFLVLRERSTTLGVAGSLLAFIGGGIVVCATGLNMNAVWYGSLFIVASSITSTYVKKLLTGVPGEMSVSPFAFFPVRMIGVLPGLGLFYLLSMDSIRLDGETLTNALLAGACVGFMFFLRFVSLSRLPLWLYATLGALQLIFTPWFGLLFNRPIAEGLYWGAAVILLGELIASIPWRRGGRR